MPKCIRFVLGGEIEKFKYLFYYLYKLHNSYFVFFVNFRKFCIFSKEYRYAAPTARSAVNATCQVSTRVPAKAGSPVRGDGFRPQDLDVGFNDVICAQDVAVYGVLCALVSCRRIIAPQSCHYKETYTCNIYIYI